VNRVQLDPRFASVSGKPWELRTQDILREHATALSQAADGRLWTLRTVTAAATTLPSETFVVVKPSGAMTLTIPAAAETRERLLIVKRGNNTTHTVTIQPVSGTIDGAASVTLTTAWQRRMFMSDGTEYFEVT
jgi:hypothetical protein